MLKSYDPMKSRSDIAVYCIIMQHMMESNKQAAEKTKEYDHEQ